MIFSDELEEKEILEAALEVDSALIVDTKEAYSPEMACQPLAQPDFLHFQNHMFEAVEELRLRRVRLLLRCFM